MAEKDAKKQSKILQDTSDELIEPLKGKTDLYPNTGPDFPAKYFSRQQAEDKIAQYKQAQDLGLSGTPDSLFEKPQITPDVVNLLQLKKEEADLMLFERWLKSIGDWNDPSYKSWLQKTYPQYFDRRKKAIETRANLMKKFALIELMGPRNHEDLLLSYGVSSGNIKIPKDMQSFITGDFGEEGDEYVARGLFNPKKVPTLKKSWNENSAKVAPWLNKTTPKMDIHDPTFETAFAQKLANF